MIGETISHYTITGKLGEGGMGVVYKAHDLRLERDVALKFLPLHTADTVEGNQRLIQEARAASSINHPNVCVIYDFEEAAGKQFIVMECVDGITLRQRLHQSPLTIDEIVDITLGIVTALTEAHAKGIVHRDIKPDNIMITHTKQVKVMDFGLAKLKDSIFQTRNSVRVGTLAYFAPEQIQGKEVHPQTDLFALGVVLYEMVTGRHPFRGEHEAAIMYSILHEECIPVSQYVPDLPAELISIINDALKKEPSERIQNAEAMAVRFRRLREGISSRNLHPQPEAEAQSARKRKLSAIVFTDMVGYSALAQTNETLALDLLSQQRKIVRSLVPKFGGKEIETIGDAFFLEFESALDASRCAFEIHKAIREHNTSAAAEQHIHLRIGIHIGDVVHMENKVHGDGVNIAARIEPLADSDGICISEDVARQIKNKIELPLLKLGTPQLKNIRLPVNIYKIILPWEKRRSSIAERVLFSLQRKKKYASAVAAALILFVAVTVLLPVPESPLPQKNTAEDDSTAISNPQTIRASELSLSTSSQRENAEKANQTFDQPLLQQPNEVAVDSDSMHGTTAATEERTSGIVSSDFRIAVLPFSNISPNNEDEYFADGMTEELISTLSKIKELRVIARTSIMQYKENRKNISDIGKELNVRAIVEGSVRKSGNKLRITVQLIDVSNQEHLWSEEYNSQLTDVFDIQSNVAKQVAHALPLKLMASDSHISTAKHPVNIEAYTLYLQGRFYWNKRSPIDLLQSVEYFKQSAQKDPRFALAQVGLADAYTLLGNYYVLPPSDAYPKAKTAALKAIELDPSLPEAHTSLGFALMHYDWNWNDAEKEFRKALEINPSYAMGQSWYAYFLTVTGRFDEAVAARKRALELDPLSIIVNSDIGLTLYFSGKYDDAVRQFRDALKMDPSFYAAYIPLGGALLQLKKNDEAIVAFKKAKVFSHDHPIPTAALAYAYAVLGRRKEAVAIADDLKKVSVQSYVSPYWIGIIYAGLGDRDAAFQWLQKGIDRHDGSMIFLKVEPILNELRSDTRYNNLLLNVGLHTGASSQ